MPTMQGPTITRLLAAAALLLATALVTADERSSRYVVVVNSDVAVHELPLGTVRTIFGMRLQAWDGGLPIKVFVLPDNHPAHVAFTKQVLGMFPHQLRWAWDRLVFSGTGQAPLQVRSEEEMRERVASTPGAIGYLRRGQIDGDIHELRLK